MTTDHSHALTREIHVVSSTSAHERAEEITVLTDRELEMVAAAGGKKGGTPEFRLPEAR